jgi:beta-glucosidase
MSAAEDRVEELLARLDLEAKVRLCTGADFWATWDEPRAGLRAMSLSDGPAGVRGDAWDERRTSTNLPSPTCMAASWDEGLATRLGRFLATEARAKGVDVLLGPTINLHRSPLGGRHFECFSEDPLLTARIGAAYVRGVQGEGVAATPKHYVANDSETERFTLDARVGERALRELYLAPFEHLVREAGAWMVMAAYNGVNGPTMTESPLLADPLKGEWGFDGVVVSDWHATRSLAAAGPSLTDLAMPGPDGPWGDDLVAAVRDGSIPEAAVDDKVRRLLRLASRVGALEEGPGAVEPAVPGAVDSRAQPVSRSATLPLRGAANPAGRVTPGRVTPGRAPGPGGAAVAREAAAAGAVLVRNQGLLPLNPAGLKRVAVVGPGAERPRSQGGGSATVFPAAVVSPVEGLEAALGTGAEVVHGRGARIRRGLEPVTAGQVTDPETGEPGLAVRFLDTDGAVLHAEHRLAGKLIWLGLEVLRRTARIEVAARLRARAGGEHGIGVAGTGRFRLTAGDRVLVDERIRPETDDAAGLLAAPQRGGRLTLAEGDEVDLTVVHHLEDGAAASVTLAVEEPSPPEDEELADAVALAAGADVAVVVVGTTAEIESEGYDRASLALPGRQDELVRAVAAANPRTVVVVNAGSPVELPWRDQVPAILLSWFPGQEFGHALADVLCGRAEPGGRLPTTWPAREVDVPVLDTRPVAGRLEYREGLHVGYRAWARAGTGPAFPFGHGLGYTTWAYQGLEAPAAADPGTEVVARARLANSGPRPGREVVQAYLARPASAIERPAFWLAGFAVVHADPGQEVTAELRLAPRAFQHWSPETRSWETEPGPYQLTVGRSSADRPLTAELTIR